MYITRQWFVHTINPIHPPPGEQWIKELFNSVNDIHGDQVIIPTVHTAHDATSCFLSGSSTRAGPWHWWILTGSHRGILVTNRQYDPFTWFNLKRVDMLYWPSESQWTSTLWKYSYQCTSDHSIRTDNHLFNASKSPRMSGFLPQRQSQSCLH